MDRISKYPVEELIKKDLTWWVDFLPLYNGVSILWLEKEREPDSTIATDSTLTAVRGFSGKQYFHMTYLQKVAEGRNIAQLEMVALILGLQLWGNRASGRCIKMFVDNQVVATVVNTGRSNDRFLQDALREIAFISATGNFQVITEFLPGVQNRIVDL